MKIVSTDNTSHYQITGQLDPSVEHDKVPSSDTQHEPVFIIPLDTEVAPVFIIPLDTEVALEQNEDSNTSIELQENEL